VEQTVADKKEQATEESAGNEEQGHISARIIHCAMEPTHWGTIEKPDGHAVITGPCGDTDEFFLRVDDGRIREVRFRTSGCFFTVASCEAVASLVDGETIDGGFDITQERVLEYLGGMPKDHEHCPLLAVNTLHRALSACLVRGKGSKPS